MSLDESLTGSSQCLNPGKGVFFPSDRLTANTVDYSGRRADGVEYAGGVRCAEGFREVGFVEDGGFLVAGE